MTEPPPLQEESASAPERAHLEHAHHEIRTALTVLQSNVELVRVQLRLDADPSTRLVLHRHLSELDLAVERLRRLATQMRAWHHAGPMRADRRA